MSARGLGLRNRLLHNRAICLTPPAFVSNAEVWTRAQPMPSLFATGTSLLNASVSLGDLFADPRTRSQAAWARFSKRDILQKLKSLDLRPDQIDDSLEILAENHLISGTNTIGTKLATKSPGDSRARARGRRGSRPRHQHPENWRSAASYVDKIIKGAKPRQLGRHASRGCDGDS
jgi:hypothetical protein